MKFTGKVVKFRDAFAAAGVAPKERLRDLSLAIPSCSFSGDDRNFNGA